MKIFNILKKKPTPQVEMQNETVPQEIKQETQNAPEPTLQPTSNEENKEIITIQYGTGMPIDILYASIHHDYEQEGYQDALINSNAEYCKTKENIILNKLRQLFNQVLLRYRADIRKIDTEITNAKTLFALGTVNMLQAHKETCEEHITEINDMIHKLEAQAPEMMIMIDSYRRGFNKGCTAKTANFLSPNHITH